MVLFFAWMMGNCNETHAILQKIERCKEIG